MEQWHQNLVKPPQAHLLQNRKFPRCLLTPLIFKGRIFIPMYHTSCSFNLHGICFLQESHLGDALCASSLIFGAKMELSVTGQ